MCMLSLQHMQHPRIYFCIIQMKHLKHKFETPETLETQHRRQPEPTWWGTPVANKLGLGIVESNGPAYTLGAVRRPLLPADGHVGWGRRHRPPLPLLLRRAKWMGHCAAEQRGM